MYEIYNDLRKISEECMEVTESHYWPGGKIQIVGNMDGKTVQIVMEKVEQDDRDQS